MNLRLLADCWLSSTGFRPLPSNVDPDTWRGLYVITNTGEGERYSELMKLLGSDNLRRMMSMVMGGPSPIEIPEPPRRRELAPLEPNAFLAWSWAQGDRQRGTSPLTVDDLWYARAKYDQETSPEEVRREIVGTAARTRRAQRLGEEYWQDDRGVWWRVGG